uniref:Uncharacterized protein n=1 Tax=viral metagenome TaxID=1070528 RepID=A0A6M3J405_9ZZZZ
MAANNKIEQYNLQDRTLSLKAEGYPTRRIAEFLTEDLAGKDTISQPTVARWLANERRKRKAAAEVILDDYISTSLPADLNILDEMVETFLSIFRYNTGGLNKTLKLLQTGVVDLKIYRELKIELDKERSINIREPDLKTGMQAADRLRDLLNTKFRFIGVGDPDDDSITKVRADEREELEEIARELAEKKRQEVNDASGS